MLLRGWIERKSATPMSGFLVSFDSRRRKIMRPLAGLEIKSLTSDESHDPAEHLAVVKDCSILPPDSMFILRDEVTSSSFPENISKLVRPWRRRLWLLAS